MKIKKSQQTYNTTDFYLSCFLLARGIQLIGLNQTDEPGPSVICVCGIGNAIRPYERVQL